MNSGNDFTKHIHVKNIIRLLSILLMVFFFVPSFMVSCAGYGNIKISAFKAMTGIKIEGESVSDPKVICIIMLLLPIAMLALWCLKSVLKVLQSHPEAVQLLTLFSGLHFASE